MICSSTVLGCLVTVLSLAMGTFTQQAIKPVICEETILGMRASVPVADRMTTLPLVRMGPAQYDLDPLIKSSIAGALSGDYNPPKLLDNCPTGNCTFGDQEVSHRTIGICSKCLDTTELVYLNRTNSSLWLSHPMGMSVNADEWLHVDPYLPINDGGEETVWAESVLDTEMQYILAANASMMRMNILTLTTDGCQYTEASQTDEPGAVSSFSNCSRKNHLPLTYLGTRRDWNVVAANCAFYACVKDMKATVKNGTLVEKVVKTTPMPATEAGRETNVLLDLPCIVNGSTYDSSNISMANSPNETLTTTDLNSPGWAHNSAMHEGKLINVPYQCAHSLRWEAKMSISLFWSTIAKGLCYSKSAAVSDIGFGRKRPFCEYGMDLDPNRLRFSWWHTGLWAEGNATFASISSKMDAVGTAITNAMRLDPITRYPSDNDRNLITGTVQQSNVCTQFDWPWLMFPAGLIVLTALALLLVMWGTAFDKEDMPVWKTSTLPLLYSDRLGTLKEIEKIASRDTAVIEKSGKVDWCVTLDQTSTNVSRMSSASPLHDRPYPDMMGVDEPLMQRTHQTKDDARSHSSINSQKERSQMAIRR